MNPGENMPSPRATKRFETTSLAGTEYVASRRGEVRASQGKTVPLICMFAVPPTPTSKATGVRHLMDSFCRPSRSICVRNGLQVYVYSTCSTVVDRCEEIFAYPRRSSKAKFAKMARSSRSDGSRARVQRSIEYLLDRCFFPGARPSHNDPGIRAAQATQHQGVSGFRVSQGTTHNGSPESA